MDAQQLMAGEAARQTRRTPARFLIALGLVIALGLAAAYGFWLKGVSLQSAPPAQPLTIVHQKPPDAVDRDAEYRAASTDAQRLAAPAAAVQRNQSSGLGRLWHEDPADEFDKTPPNPLP